MPAKSWLCGAMTTTTSGRIPRWETKPRQKHAGRLSYMTETRPARLPNPKPTTINTQDSRYERGTTGGQVTNLKPTTINKPDSRYERGTTGGQVISRPALPECPAVVPGGA